MQRIATSVPDIAVLPVNVKPDTYGLESSYEQFNQLLKERDIRFERVEQPVEREYAVRRPERIERPEVVERSNIRENDRKISQSPRDSKPSEQAETEGRTSASQQENKVENSSSASQQPSQNDKGAVSKSEDNNQQAASDQNQELIQKPLDESIEQGSEEEVDWLALLEKVEKNAQSAIDKESRLTEDAIQLGGPIEEVINTDALLKDEQGESLDGQLEVALNNPLEGKLFADSEANSDAERLSVLEEFAKLLNKLNQDVDSGDRAEQLAELQGVLGELLKNKDVSAEEVRQFADNESTVDLEGLDLSLILSLLGSGQQNEELTAEQLGLFEAEQDVELTELPLEQNTDSDIVVPVSDKAIDALLKLDGKKLDDALANLAERINQLALDGKNSEVQKSLLDDEVIQKAANLFANNEQKSQFIANLKAGLQEMSKQLQQGREPGLNLKSLVEESLGKTMPKDMPVAELNLASLDLAVTSFSKALESTTVLQTQLQQQVSMTAGLERAVRDGSQQIQLEQAKQVQQQMNFEKAANINRPEGQVQIVEKVRWMVNQNNLQADIRLDPPELGSMKVKVQMSGEAASVSFVVQSQQARDVFEQNAPRLKELLEEQGIELGQSSVEQEQHQTQEQDSQLAGGADNEASELDEPTEHTEQRIVNGRIGGIDYFV